MTLEVSLDPKTGGFRFSYKRHIFVALGLLFVGAGLATLSGPWWLPLLEAVLGKAGLVVEPSYQLLLGGVQIVVGIGFLAYKHFIFDRRHALIEADRALIQRSPLDFDRLRSYLTNLVDDHSYTSGLHTEFYEAWTRFNKPEDSFQVERTAALYKSFAAAANALEKFIGPHFWPFPRGQHAGKSYRYCLAPHLNMDREMIFYDPAKEKEYDSLKIQLHQLVAQTAQALDEFAKDLRAHGHV